MAILDSHDSQPLYQQLYGIIKMNIDTGVYKKGEKIPTEAELSKIYSMSRVTVRNALERLTRENYLVRSRGRGTFVSEEKFQRSIVENLSFTDMCRNLNRVPGAKTIKSVIEDALPEDIEELNLSEGDKVIVIERIRYLDGIPVSVESGRYTERFSFLINEDLNTQSMYEVLREKYGITFGRTSRRLEIIFSSYQLSKYLNISIGYPLISLSGTVYDSNDVPSYRNKQFIVGDKFAFTL